MQERFVVYSLGFFAYPFRNTRNAASAAEIAAFRCGGHSLALALLADRARASDLTAWRLLQLPAGIDTVPDPAASAMPASVEIGFASNGNRLSPRLASVKRRPFAKDGDFVGGDHENLDLIPNARFVLKPARLRSGWQSDVKLRIATVGGELTAVPDFRTFTEIWSLGPKHRQRVSNLARYTVGEDVDSLVVGPVAYPITNRSVLVAVNLAPPTQLPTAMYQRGLDHTLALAKLCEPTAALRVHSPGKRTRKEMVNKEATEYATFAVNAKRVIADVPAEAEDGYPSCRGKSIEVR